MGKAWLRGNRIEFNEWMAFLIFRYDSFLIKFIHSKMIGGSEELLEIPENPSAISWMLTSIIK